MSRKVSVHPGDIIAVTLRNTGVVPGLVLHVSKYFRKGMIVGFYDALFPDAAQIHIEELGGPFIETPNYTSVEMVQEGDWPIIGQSAELLSSSNVPTLRVVYDLFLRDDVVGRVAPADAKAYPVLQMMGKVYLENMLARHFRARKT